MSINTIIRTIATAKLMWILLKFKLTTAGDPRCIFYSPAECYSVSLNERMMKNVQKYIEDSLVRL